MPNLSALPQIVPSIVVMLVLTVDASLLAQTTLRGVLGQASLDDLLAQRDLINQKLHRTNC